MSLNAIGSTTTNLSYSFPNGFTVASGATLAVGPNVSVVVSGGQTLSVAGALSFATGDSFTLSDPCCYSPSQISVGGSLTANGTTFNGDTRTTFTITPTGTISGASNTFNTALIVPYNDVSALAGNTSFEQIEISGGTLSSGTVSLNSIGSITTNLSYVFLNGFTVASGATLAVGPNVPVVVSGGQTLSVAGTLSFATGDTFTLSDPCCYSPSQISVSGSLIANGTTFSGDTRTSFTITSTGTISAPATSSTRL